LQCNQNYILCTPSFIHQQPCTCISLQTRTFDSQKGSTYDLWSDESHISSTVLYSANIIRDFREYLTNFQLIWKESSTSGAVSLSDRICMFIFCIIHALMEHWVCHSGLHFSSLYPSGILSFNISFTYLSANRAHTNSLSISNLMDNDWLNINICRRHTARLCVSGFCFMASRC
jgi:hypothetical protein